MKHLGSYESYKDAFIDFKEKINQIYEYSFILKEFQSKKILDLTKKILESDIFLEEEVIENSEILLFENIFGDILNLLNELKVLNNWNDNYFWLIHNSFLYFWFDTISFFKEDIKNQLIYILDVIWGQIQNAISKWNTDFPLEFILGVSFLLWKGKEELLNYLNNLKKNFENSSFSELIQNLIQFISLGNLPIDVFSFSDQKLGIKSCITILIMRFGRLDDCKIALKTLNPIISDKWEQILTNDDRLIKDSIIRDWITTKYIELILVKKIESESILKTPELPYFSISPREFERLIYWIIKSDKKWINVQWRGAAGKEKGKDIFATKVESNKNWIVQAKRDKNFSRKDLNDEFLNVKPELAEYDAEGYIVCIAKNASDDLRKAGEEIQQKNDYLIELWDSEDLNFIVKTSPRLLYEFFNY